MSVSQQAERCLNIKLAWEIIQEMTVPIDRDFALHAIGKNLIERNTDIYQEALANVEILCDMFINVANVSGSVNTLMRTTNSYLYFDEHKSLVMEITNLLKRSEPETKNILSRSKSQAQRFNGVVEACQKQEHFKSSKVVQRILSSKTAAAMNGQGNSSQLTYVDNTLFDKRSECTGISANAVPVMSYTLSEPISYQPSVRDEIITIEQPSFSSTRQTLLEEDFVEKASGIQDENDENDWDEDFYTIDISSPKIQSTKIIEEQAKSKEQQVEPNIYSAKALSSVKLTASDYTTEFITKIRNILDIEYNYLLKKVEKIHETIVNTAKVNEIALTISQELLETTKNLTEQDIARLKGAITHQLCDQEIGSKGARPPLLQEHKAKQLLASPTHNTPASLSLTGSMTTLKCLPKITK